MQVKRAVKTVSKTGDSLTVAITKEAKALGLDKGDSVTIMVGDLSPEEVRNFDLAMSLSNNNAYYTNEYWLNPSDHYLNGSQIEDMSETLDPKVMLETQQRLFALRWFRERAQRFTRERISSPHAFYSDSQRSFVTKFKPVTEPDTALNDYIMARYYLEILEDALKDVYTEHCPLKSVMNISASVSRAIKDLRDLEGTDDDKLDDKVRQLNEIWVSENSDKKYPDTWYFSITIIGKSPISEIQNNYLYIEMPEFHLYEGPYKKYVEKLVKEYDKKMEIEDQLRYSVVIGPFGTEEDARSVMSYLRMDSILHNKVGNMDYLVDAKRQAYSLMDSLDKED